MKSPIQTVALDFGAGNFKMFGPDGGVVIPSHVAAFSGDQIGEVAGVRSVAGSTRISINGYRFYVGRNAHAFGRPVENLDDGRFAAGTPELRALTYSALSSLTQSQINIIVGLPQTTLAGAQARTTTEGLRDWLTGTHTWTVNDTERAIDVQKVTISSQAAGGMFDYLLDQDGKFLPERKARFREEIGVISIGMNTIEFLVVNGGESVGRFSGSVTAGVRRLLELVDPRGMYSRGELDTMLQAKKLDVKPALPIWGAEVAGHVERIWGRDHRRFAAIVIVGGGAVLLREELVKLFNGKSFFPDDPILAVSRGLFKLALMKGK